MTNKKECETPKTKLELILDFLRDVLSYFKSNKFIAVIFWAGVSIGIASWSIGMNAESINSIVNLFK